jgi:hypothetical protein
MTERKDRSVIESFPRYYGGIPITEDEKDVDRVLLGIGSAIIVMVLLWIGFIAGGV